MPREERTRERQPAGQEMDDAATNQRRANHTRARQKAQAGAGAVGKVTRRGRLLFIGGRRVASLHNGWLRRNLRHEGELLFGDAIAFRAELLDLARIHAERGVCVRMPDGTVLTSAWRDWDAYAFEYGHRTYGRQRALPLARWHRPGERVAVQTSLWHGGVV